MLFKSEITGIRNHRYTGIACRGKKMLIERERKRLSRSYIQTIYGGANPKGETSFTGLGNRGLGTAEIGYPWMRCSDSFFVACPKRLTIPTEYTKSDKCSLRND
jgi:hypothetical protein